MGSQRSRRAILGLCLAFVGLVVASHACDRESPGTAGDGSDPATVETEPSEVRGERGTRSRHRKPAEDASAATDRAKPPEKDAAGSGPEVPIDVVRVRVIVTDQGGDPVEDAEVKLKVKRWSTQRTDSAGIATFETDPRKWTLITAERGDEIAVSPWFSVPGGNTVVRRLTLEAGVRITGRVEHPNVSEVTGLAVSVSANGPQGETHLRGADLDAQGRFEVGPFPRSTLSRGAGFSLGARTKWDRTYWRSVRQIDAGEVVLALEPWVPVVGRLVDERGDPVGRARIMPFRRNPTNCNADARFTLEARLGDVVPLLAKAPGRAAMVWEIPGGHGRDRLDVGDLTMYPARKIEGSAFELDGTPVAKGQVRVLAPGFPVQMLGAEVVDGRFTVKGAGAGPYELRVVADEDKAHDRPRSGRATVSRTDGASVRIVISEGMRLALRVLREEDGTPVDSSSLHVTAFPPGQGGIPANRGGRSASVGPISRVEVSFEKAGTYDVLLTADRRMPKWIENVPIVEGSVTERDVLMAPLEYAER